VVIVVPGPASTELGRRVATLLGARMVPVSFKRFPDGESYVRFMGEVEGEVVAVIQTTSPPQNERLIQLLLMADNAKDMGAKSVIAVVPYLAYARQDRRFLPGEAFSLKTVVRLLQCCGVDELITVNVHNPTVLRSLQIPFRDLSAIGVLAQHLMNKGLQGAFSISLGKKGLEMAREAHNILRGGYGYIQTRRDRVTGEVSIEEKPLPIHGRDVIIFDDIISSGGTMAKAVRWAKDQGARRVYAACVHPLLAPGAMERILESGADGVVGTDCVPSPVSRVSVAPLIAEALGERKGRLE